MFLGYKPRRSRGLGRHFCENCGRRYYDAKNLRRHLSHECGKKPYLQCIYCPYKSTYKFYLDKHIEKHRSGISLGYGNN